MKTIREMIEGIDMSPDNEDRWIDLSIFCSELNVIYYDYLEADDRMKCFSITT